MNSILISDHGGRVTPFPARSTSLGAGGIAGQDPWRRLNFATGSGGARALTRGRVPAGLAAFFP
jgi:hypothetical protein